MCVCARAPGCMCVHIHVWASLVAQLVKNPTASADVGSVPGSGRFPGGGNGNPPSVLTWEIPWTDEPGGLQSTGWQSRTRLSD